MRLKIKHTLNCTMKFAYTKDYGLNIIVKYSGLYIFQFFDLVFEKLLLIQMNTRISLIHRVIVDRKVRT